MLYHITPLQQKAEDCESPQRQGTLLVGLRCWSGEDNDKSHVFAMYKRFFSPGMNPGTARLDNELSGSQHLLANHTSCAHIQ
jgi:hypothetical protein